MMRAIALLALGLPAVAQAQAYQCRIPDRPVAVPRVERDGPVRQMPVTGYTLAASWSPEFCKPRQGQRAHARQCGGDGGRFGMVLHGLWPDGRSGRWPQWCPTPRRPSPASLSRNLCMSPSARLLARQWAKHGACMTRRPETYFRVSNILWRSLRWPDFDLLSRREDLRARDIREAFVLANPYWTADEVGVKLNERGWLQEIRLCYGRDFLPIRCDRARFGAADSARAKIWRGL